MGKVGREMEILRKNQKQILEAKNTAAEMKNAFDGLVSRLDISIEISKAEKHTMSALRPQWN